MSFVGGLPTAESLPGEEFEDLEERPSQNDLVILKALGEDEDAREQSFQGIRRKLGLHQETLSRALHRLQRDGFVERLDHAYRISPKGVLTIGGDRPRVTESGNIERVDPYSISLLRARLPPEVSTSEIVSSLSYKWFGNLRWFGSTQTPESATMSWITDATGLKISVRIKDDVLTIETYPTSTDSISEATKGAFELFDHISKALKGRGSPPGSRLNGKAA